MKFPVVFLVLCFVAVAFANFKCKNDVPYIENGCNTCACANENLACTLKLCPGGKSDELKKCEVGDKWKHHCNDCWCVKDLGTICTNNQC